MDGFIEFTEYEGALADTDFYSDWDTDLDDYLTEEELAMGVFNRWDTDNSGTLDMEEYGDFDSYYLDI